MDYNLTDKLKDAAVVVPTFALAAGATAFVLTRLNPLHGAIYGLALGVFEVLGFQTISGDDQLWKRAVEYIASSTVAYACLKLAGVALAPQTAALLSVSVLGISFATVVVVLVVADQFKKPEPKRAF